VVALKLVAQGLETTALGALDVLTPAQMARVLRSEHVACGSERLSEHVASFCSAHAAAVDKALLASLAAPAAMPTVAPAAALRLLKFALLHEGSATGTDAQDPAADTLLARCMLAASSNYLQVFPEEPAAAAAAGLGSPPAAAPDEPAAKKRRTAEGAPKARGLRGEGMPSEVTVGILEGALRASHGKITQQDAKIKQLNAKLTQARVYASASQTTICYKAIQVYTHIPACSNCAKIKML
jgi:hypothetical protein